jgi:hypothetical protein
VWKNLLGMSGGITPYLSFAPKLSGIAAERRSFNQPDVWTLVRKRPEAMGMRPAQREARVEVHQGGKAAVFDPTIGEGGVLDSGLEPGMHALARAQVYYHRPGAWAEMPNFFNPFWGARLAPKSPVIHQLLEAAGLPVGWAELVGDNLWMF